MNAKEILEKSHYKSIEEIDKDRIDWNRKLLINLMDDTEFRMKVVEDYKTLRLSLKYHPLALLRTELLPFGLTQNDCLKRMASGQHVKIAGLVLVRQRPSTAKGVIFTTLEDETGIANIIVWPSIFERYRQILLNAKLLGVEGELQREGIVIHVVAKHLINLNANLKTLVTQINTPQISQTTHQSQP